MGFKTDSEPKGYDAMQLVFDGWCLGTYEDEASHHCIRAETAPEERAKANGG